MFLKKSAAICVSLLLITVSVGCSLIVEPDPSSTAAPTAASTSEAAAESEITASLSSPTGSVFNYISSEFIYRLTSYIGADNTNNEKAFNDLKIDTSEFVVQEAEDGVISKVGIHEIDGTPAFSFILNSDKDDKLYDISLVMYPEFMKKTTESGNTIYPYFITYTICAALQCDANKATSLILNLMSDENGAKTGKYSFESRDIYYNFIKGQDSTIFTLTVGGEGSFSN